MAASAAMAGLSACTKLPTEKIVPYVRPPEEILAGRPLFYATSLFQAGVATGVLVKATRAGRLRSKETPSIPEASGSSDIFNQASILNFYDPDRSQSVITRGESVPGVILRRRWGQADELVAQQGCGNRLLTKAITSPTLGAQMRALLAQFPAAKWHQYEVCSGDSVREGSRLAFGRPVSTVYHFDQADVIVSLDADFLTCGSGHVRYARDFASRRDLSAGVASNLNRLYVVESMPTSTGAVSDHRLRFARRTLMIWRVSLQLLRALPYRPARTPVRKFPQVQSELSRATWRPIGALRL